MCHMKRCRRTISRNPLDSAALPTLQMRGPSKRQHCSFATCALPPAQRGLFTGSFPCFSPQALQVGKTGVGGAMNSSADLLILPRGGATRPPSPRSQSFQIPGLLTWKTCQRERRLQANPATSAATSAATLAYKPHPAKAKRTMSQQL